jgi:hypothetical protein
MNTPAEQVVERGEEDQQCEARHGPDRLDGAADVEDRAHRTRRIGLRLVEADRGHVRQRTAVSTSAMM